jgi:hypothetical protein
VCDPSWISANASSVSLVIAVAALLYNNRKAADREIRKELRSLLDSAIKQVDSIHDLAIDFHTSIEFKASKNIALRHDIQRVANEIYRSDEMLKEIINVALDDFRQAISLRNFDLTSFSQQERDSEICLLIDLRTSRLISTINEIYHARNKI